MIRSMTAFARVEMDYNGTEIEWELRSVNHRYLDIQPRMHEELRGMEPALREKISRRVSRGKLECSLRYRLTQAADSRLQVDQQCLQSLLAAYREIEQLISEPGIPRVMDLMQWPGVIEEQTPALQDINTPAMELLDRALDEFIETREREGAKITDMLLKRCDGVQAQVAVARKVLPDIQMQMRDKLLTRLEKLAVPADESRLEQELVFLAQKLDVDEEIDRLEAHVEEVRNVLKRKEPVGRRLDFLMQELNREANTLASKSVDKVTTDIAVELKVLIEQMREQVQNVE
ncbi:MAG: YicC/YloC family endoribonuclease [Gammaproteobacteria bacterium]